MNGEKRTQKKRTPEKRTRKKGIRPIFALLLCAVLVLSGCVKKPGSSSDPPTDEPVTASDPETTETPDTGTSETESAGPEISETGSKDTESTETEPSGTSDPETEPSSETETTEPSSEDRPAPDETRFFGRPADPEVRAYNMMELEDPDTGLYDVLSEPRFTAEDLLMMLRAFPITDNGYYRGHDLTDEDRNALYALRNEGPLPERGTEKTEVRYGIVTKNTSVRTVPTDEPVYIKSDGHGLSWWEHFDDLQQSMWNVGTGVLILHESADQEWVFAQGFDYYGWIRRADVAETDEEGFRAYLTKDRFAVVTEPYLDADGLLLRMGTVLSIADPENGDPAEENGDPKEEDEEEQGLLIEFPERDENGFLHLKTAVIKAGMHEGYLPVSPDMILEHAEKFVWDGVSYGWGDTNAGFDCSSFCCAV